MIEDYNIFNKSEDEYYVYFYKDNCKYCIDSYETINKYLSDVSNAMLTSYETPTTLFESLETNTFTIRDRDTMQQERISVDDLIRRLDDLILG